MFFKSHGLMGSLIIALSLFVGLSSGFAQTKPPAKPPAKPPVNPPPNTKPKTPPPADPKSTDTKAGDAKVAEGSSDAAVRQFREAVAFQNREAYDLAVDEWEKFLEKFPTDPLAGKAQHYAGVCYQAEKKLDEARAAYEKTIAKYPELDLLDLTYLNLGSTYLTLAQAGKPELFDKASEAFNNVLTKFPKSAQAAAATYYLGESLYDRNKKDDAVKQWLDLVKKYPDSPLLPEALYSAGVTQEELKHNDQAGATYDTFLKDFPQHPHANEVAIRKGETLMAQGKFTEAEKRFAGAASIKDFDLADHAMLRQGAALYDQKKYAEAAAVYAGLIEKFPKSKNVGDATLAAGKCYYLAGNYADARKWLDKARALGGETAADATHWAARSLLKEKQPAEALKVIEKALADAPADKKPVSLLLDQADASFELPDRRSAAVGQYAAVADKFPNDPLAPQARYMAGFAALGNGDAATALDQAQKFLKAHPDHALAPDVNFVAAESSLLLGKNAEAEKLYADLLAKHPGHAEAEQWQVRRLLALYLDKKYDAVVTALKTLLPQLKNPDNVAEAQYLLGSSQLEMQQSDAAITSLQASLKAQPKWRQADETLLNLARAQRQKNDVQGARATVEKLIADFPQSKALDRAHYRLGEYLYAANDFKQAAAEYQKVLDTWPSSPVASHAQLGLAWAKLSQQDNEGAEKAIGALLDKKPDAALLPRAHFARATARQQLKQFAPAIEDLQAFLDSNPPADEKADALYLRGLCEEGLKKYDDAVKTLESIAEVSPKYPGGDKVLYELGWTRDSLNKPDEAADSFQKLISQYPASPLAAEALFYIGERQYTKKDYAAAATSYEQTGAKAGKSDLGEKAAHKLAWAEFQQGNFEAAQKSFESQLAAYPQGERATDAQVMIGECLFKQNKYAPALAAFEKALATRKLAKSFEALALLHAGQSAGQLKQWEPSLKLLEQLVKELPDSAYVNEARYEEGWAKKNLGQLDDALKLFEVVAEGPVSEVSARARFMMGEIFFERKDHKEAIRNYFKVAYGLGSDLPKPIEVWQAESIYEAAFCFEIMQKPDQAKKLYAELIKKYPESDKVPLAKQKLQALGG